MEHRRRVLERGAAVRRTRPAHPVQLHRRCALPRGADHASRRGQHGGLLQGNDPGGAHTARSFRHALLRRRVLRCRRDLGRAARLRVGSRRPRAGAANRSGHRARGGGGAGRDPAAAPVAGGQARADLRRRPQILVAGLRHAGSRHERRRHRHREIDRGRQGPHPRPDGTGRADDPGQRPDRPAAQLPRTSSRHPDRWRPLYLSGAQGARAVPRCRPCAQHRLRRLCGGDRTGAQPCGHAAQPGLAAMPARRRAGRGRRPERTRHGRDRPLREAAGGQPAENQPAGGRLTGLPGARPGDAARTWRARLHLLQQAILHAPLPGADRPADHGDGSDRRGDRRRWQRGGGAAHHRREERARGDRPDHHRAVGNPGRGHPAHRPCLPRAASGTRRHRRRAGQRQRHAGLPGDRLRRGGRGDHRAHWFLRGVPRCGVRAR